MAGVSDTGTSHVRVLGELLRAQRQAAGLSLRELSERTEVSNAYLSQLERGLNEPSLSVLRAIAGALGVPLGTLLARAGLLDDEADADGGGPRDTEAAIHADRELSEAQRFALL